MPDGFDTDLFPSVEALKAGLDPLDLQELQLLSDPNNLTDPATEESFKLDRLQDAITYSSLCGDQEQEEKNLYILVI